MTVMRIGVSSNPAACHLMTRASLRDMTITVRR
jgi:hypothetical protein